MPRRAFDLNFLPVPPSRLQNNTESPSSPASPLSPSNTSSSQRRSQVPPPRLNLRTLLSPPFPKLFINTVPRTPYPWVWRCHICNSIYRLGVTRRCLTDGHYFCSVPSPPPSPVSSASSPSGGWASSEAEKERAEKERRDRRRLRRRARGCRTEFDYTGWGEYNSWRREVRAIKYGRQAPTGHMVSILRHWGRRDGDSRFSSLERGRHGDGRDCWRDCNFPSECHNERKAEREWILQRERMRVLEEEWKVEEEAALKRNQSAGNVELKDQETIWSTSDESGGRVEDGEMLVYAEGLGPLGTDCDGLGEEGVLLQYAQSKRKKDVDVGADSPPSSPLKECAFGIEDVDINRVTLAGGSEKKESCDENKGKQEELNELKLDEDGDVQMREALMARSLFLRKYDGGDKFGDEDDGEIL